jgi:K(+)-stimulated pyrophosphate-energized sodium pump
MVWQELVALISGVVSVALAAYLYKWVMAQVNENKTMAEFSSAIQEGAAAYLRRLFQALGLLAAVITIILLIALGWRTALAYIIGSTCSALAGYAGMYVSTRANARVAWAARSGLKKAFPVGFYAGAVMGFSVVGLALIGMTIFYMLFHDPTSSWASVSGPAPWRSWPRPAAASTPRRPISVPTWWARSSSLWPRMTRATRPSSPITWAITWAMWPAWARISLIPTWPAVVAVMILGYELYQNNTAYVIYPLAALCCRHHRLADRHALCAHRRGQRPWRRPQHGTIVTTIYFRCCCPGRCLCCWIWTSLGASFGPPSPASWRASSSALPPTAFTDIDQKSVQNTANAALTGPAIVILQGFSYGLLSIVPSIIGICAATVAAYFLAQHFGVAGTYGVSVAAVGMLAITGMIVSADAYGPIVDNAKGCAEVGHESEETIRVCRPPGCGGQHRQGHHQGLCHRRGGADGAGPLCRLCRDGGRP